MAAMVFDGEHPVAGCSRGGVGIRVDLPALGAGAPIPSGRSCKDKPATAGLACTRLLSLFNAVQIAAGGADEHVLRVPPVFGQEIAGKHVDFMAAMAAGLFLDPKEILDMGLRGTAFQASGAVEGADLLFQTEYKPFCRFSIALQIEVLDLAVHDPVGHRIDVVARHVAPDAVGFDERRTTAHEGIGNGDPFQVVGGVENFPERLVTEFGKEKPSKQRPRLRANHLWTAMMGR
jgi:hypothetical protein